eukprot:TRINITY_DN9782_c0_g1_i1.p1 TRINITY_DN9782_c0_g1~~TRINITY_DN9782_c0_g1_i1.p1  ORF type:complete len:147 (-),score=46.37 TRINITY_DN9782_c0_g1_i1:23-463(-)
MKEKFLVPFKDWDLGLKQEEGLRRKFSSSGWVVVESLPTSTGESFQNEKKERKRIFLEFEKLLSQDTIDLEKLKKLSRSFGVPAKQRAEVWKLLSGYLPPGPKRHSLLKKRREMYRKFLEKYYHNEATRDRTLEQQVKVDAPRTLR